ncbi:MAG: hypothetical protein OEV93_05185, partial [Candidatus Moranbacteria bacterium]|nr:hypothetical protein [Candidatus Moranbacteria bacterium]
MGKECSWVPEEEKSYVHEVEYETNPGQRKGVFFVGSGEEPGDYEKRIEEALVSFVKDTIRKEQRRGKFQKCFSFEGENINFQMWVEKARFGIEIPMKMKSKPWVIEIPQDIKNFFEEKKRTRERIAEAINALTHPASKIEFEGSTIEISWEGDMWIAMCKGERVVGFKSPCYEAYQINSGVLNWIDQNNKSIILEEVVKMAVEEGYGEWEDTIREEIPKLQKAENISNDDEWVFVFADGSILYAYNEWEGGPEQIVSNTFRSREEFDESKALFADD